MFTLYCKQTTYLETMSINRGTGAGGANTNINGLTYEASNDLRTEYMELRERRALYNYEKFHHMPNGTALLKNVVASSAGVSGWAPVVSGQNNFMTDPRHSFQTVSFNKAPEIEFETGTKGQFSKFLDEYENKEIQRLHGTKQPDIWFVRDDTIFIIELKFQRGAGSVCEKLQTARNKKRNLQRRYPGKEIHYLYGLHSWFRVACAAEIKDLEEDGIPYFWGDDPEFKSKMVDYILSNL